MNKIELLEKQLQETDKFQENYNKKIAKYPCNLSAIDIYWKRTAKVQGKKDILNKS